MNPSTPPNKFALPVDFVKGVDEEPSFHPSSTSRFGRPVPMDDVHAAMSVQRNHPGLICSTGDAFEFQPVSKECFGPPLGQPQAVSSRSPSQTRLRKEDYDILEAHFRDEREPDMYTREFLAAIFNVETKMVTVSSHTRCRTQECTNYPNQSIPTELVPPPPHERVVAVADSPLHVL